MNDATRNELSREILNKWAAYRKTGLTGLRQQVIDRLAAIGTTVPQNCEDGWLGEVIHTFVRA